MEYDLIAASCWQLIEQHPELREIRTRWSAQPPGRRRLAADFAYHHRIASDLFAAATGAGRRDPSGSYVVAVLAIDPDFPPALLTAGSLEYQCGRPAEAMECFLRLTRQPPDTEDLIEIIDKAGSFLLDVPDPDRARDLYAAAAIAFPNEPTFVSALSYCAAKQRDKATALDLARKAAALAPGDAVMVSDLGWALVETNEYAEAETVLRRAIAMAPAKTMAEENLRELQRRRSLRSRE